LIRLLRGVSYQLNQTILFRLDETNKYEVARMLKSGKKKY